MTRFISHLHSDLRSTKSTHRGATHAARDVPQGIHKTYPRMDVIILPSPQHIPMSLTQVLEKRNSYSTGGTNSTMSLDTLGTLLGTALKKREGVKKRNYPSGGALYPIETYILTNALKDNGKYPIVFHYNPTQHSLEKLWAVPADVPLQNLIQKFDTLSFSAIIVFTSVWKRSSAKYGDFTYTLALLEAGHMSENILLTAAALNLNARPMAGFDDQALTTLLELDMEEEQVVHTVILS